MKRRTTTIIVIASVVGLAAIGAGAWGVKNLVDNTIKIPAAPAAAAVVNTATSTPTPTAVAIGGVLDEETALELRREMPDNGDFAYKLPDGRWIRTNRHQPLPAEVTAAEQTKADAVPLPTGGSLEDVKKVRQNATNARGAYNYATGRNVVLVLQGLQGSHGANRVMWQMDANNNLLYQLHQGENGWATADEVVARAQQLIATMPDAGDWDIIVAHQH
ncbi:hypothetical protein [Leifsonia aquatica]|uniref:hypothetical protein n=1 Tax=Leifsonia aquatica TaxID=144185 RepID=UPI0037FADCDE